MSLITAVDHRTATVALPRVDPAWDSIRHDSRFQALLASYAKYKPAVTYDTPPAASSSTSAD